MQKSFYYQFDNYAYYLGNGTPSWHTDINDGTHDLGAHMFGQGTDNIQNITNFKNYLYNFNILNLNKIKNNIYSFNIKNKNILFYLIFSNKHSDSALFLIQ